MDQTPAKVVKSEFFCFLCGCNLGKDRVRVFGKSAVDIAGLIKRTLDVDVSVYSSRGIIVFVKSNYGQKYRDKTT